jgi:hypothetical protein
MQLAGFIAEPQGDELLILREVFEIRGEIEGSAALIALATRPSIERKTSLDLSSTSRRDHPSTMAVTSGVTARIMRRIAATPMAKYLINGWRKEKRITPPR